MLTPQTKLLIVTPSKRNTATKDYEMSKYQVKFSMVFRELDNYVNGCGNECKTDFLDEPIVILGESKEALLKAVCKQFNVNMGSVLLNSCDEVGRIDVQTYTKGSSGTKCVYDKYQEGFKRGDYDLWLNCFIGECTTVPEVVDFEGFSL